MHDRIREVATSIKGFDWDSKLVERATNEGWEMTLGDAQSFDLGERFDVLWAGELIEHLSNPGGFLDSALRHLAPSGRLVLTTPTRSRCRTLSTGCGARSGLTRTMPVGTALTLLAFC